MVPGVGRALGETVVVTMTSWFALGTTPGARLLIFAPLIVILGPAVVAYSGRNAG
jgi:ABC-type phosphate transport system permease subunit